MAGKGGGAWKVAYADFVTAMMAFFLVMWLISQDQKLKESIAHYFQGPVGMNLLGKSSREQRNGGMLPSEMMGPVPGQTDRAAGRSMGTFPEPATMDNETLVVAEWLLADPKTSEKWEAKAKGILRKLHQEEPDATDQAKIEDAARNQ